MSDIELILQKVKRYAFLQSIIDAFGLFLMILMMTIIAFSVALIFLKSPWYGLIGIIPVFLYRPKTLIQRARALEEKIGSKGEIINSIQLSLIKTDSKEKYSNELIQAYITDAAQKIKQIEPQKYISFRQVYSGFRFVLIAIAFALVHPVICPSTNPTR